MNKGYIFLFVFSLLSSIRPIFLKSYKKFIDINFLISALCLFIGSSISYYFIYKDFNYIKEVHFKDLIPGIISQIKFLLKYYGIVLLPSFIGIPLTATWLIFSIVFDKLLNNAHYSIKRYLEFFVIFIGILIINYKKLINKNDSSYSNIGIIMILLSSVLSGFLTTYFRSLTIKSSEPLKTMILESKGAVFLSSIIVLGLKIYNKLEIPNKKTLLHLIIVNTLLFTLALYLKLKGQMTLTQSKGVLFSNIGFLLSIIISVIYFKEKIDKIQIGGLITIALAIISSMIN